MHPHPTPIPAALTDELDATHEYEVIVGNVGTVYRGTQRWEALVAYRTYRLQSYFDVGRTGNEEITLIEDGELIYQYTPVFEAIIVE